ncbi:MAG: hypothetical protein ACI976_000043 [Aureispira sp.]|jgi:hypothetical protein
MILEQEHIINKVILEVETNSTKVANDLKDHLGMFLKEDILPYLENYFKSIEQQLPAEIVQIPQLTLEINVNSQDNFNALKTDTKEKLVQKIDAILKAPSQATEEVMLINTQEHQERSLLFFIENGYTPWWKTSSDSIHFTHEEITEIASKSSFSNQYIQLLQKPISKKRCIQQFTDQELHTILKSSFKHIKEISILQDDFIKLLTQLSTVSRDFLWNEIITYLQSKNVTVFIEKISSVLIKNPSVQGERVYAFAKAVLTLIQQGFKITETETIAVLQKESVNISQNKETLVSQLITIFDTIGLSKEANTMLQPLLHSGASSFKKQKETKETKETKEQKQGQEQEQTSNEISAPREVTSKHKEEDHLEIKDQEKITPKEDKNIEKSIATSKEESSTPLNENNNATKDHIETPKEKEAIIDKIALTKDVIRDTDTHIDTSKKESKKSEVIIQTNNPDKEEIQDSSQKENSQEKSEAVIQTNSSHKEEAQGSSQKENSQEKSEEVIQTNSYQRENAQEKVAQQYEEFINQFNQESNDMSTIDTYIKEISSQQEEVFLTNTGSYHVPNAGLIILHPYLKLFFYNCGIIDDTNVITDPEMAVHTLHYLATKKEQQLESQMLFEKFLCGIPVKKSIQRQIQLSDTIKQQAEELLESVVENWGMLNNASADLLRYEFLQRAGKLSFKEDNPKIVIERKTQDILVDKLPWGIGICRLPWLDHLVYTNW